MLYIYGPAGDVAHWKQELAGTLPNAGDVPPSRRCPAPSRNAREAVSPGHWAFPSPARKITVGPGMTLSSHRGNVVQNIHLTQEPHP